MRRQFSMDLTAKLRKLKTREGCTLFMILLGGLQLLLRRHTGMTDILVGAPVAGRHRQEFEPLIGCFLNHLVLRTNLSGNLTFRQLLHRVREVVLEAYAHQDIPFERLVEELKPVRDPSRTPLFQVLLNMHNFSDRDLPLSGLTTSSVTGPTTHSLFDFTLYFQEYRDQIHAFLTYNTDLFGEPRMQEMMTQLQQLLEQVVDHPSVAGLMPSSEIM